MRPATIVLAVGLLTPAPARADEPKDAPAGLASAAVGAWRALPGAPPVAAAPGTPSLALIAQALRELQVEPLGRAQAAEDARRALALDPEDKTAFALMKLSEGRARRASEFDKAQPKLADSVEREYHGMMQQLSQAEQRRESPADEPGPSAAERLTSS